MRGHIGLLLLLAIAPLAAGEGEGDADDGADEAAAGEELCIITFTPSADFRHVAVIKDLVLTDADRWRILNETDVDDDGVVTTAEVAAFETASRNETQIHRDGDEGERRLIRNGFDAPALTFWNDLQAAEGPVLANRTFKMAETREYDFTFGAPDDVREILFEGGAEVPAVEPQVVIETVVVSAPSGWRVGRANDQEILASSATLRGFDVYSHYAFTFVKDAAAPPQEPPQDLPPDAPPVPVDTRSRDAPEPAVIFSLGAAGVAAIAFRGRR